MSHHHEASCARCPWKTTASPKATGRPRRGCPSLPGGPREPAPRVYLVECGHGGRAHHQGYADDRVAVEAIRVGHHHDPSDGEDGGHDLRGRKTRWLGQRWGIGGAPKGQGVGVFMGVRWRGGSFSVLLWGPSRGCFPV